MRCCSTTSIEVHVGVIPHRGQPRLAVRASAQIYNALADFEALALAVGALPPESISRGDAAP